MTDNDPKHRLRERQREQELFKNATAAALKALSGESEINVTFSAHEPTAARLPFSDSYKAAKLPNIGDPESEKEKTTLRAAADIRALHFAHHNVELHKSRQPNSTEGSAVWDAIERARCEALGMRKLKGIEKNLNQALNEDCRNKRYNIIENKDDCPLAEAMYIMARTAFSETDILPNARNIHDLWQNELSSKLGNTNLSSLIPFLESQDDFAQNAHNILNSLGIEGFDLPTEEQDQQAQSADDNEEDDEQDDSSESQDSTEQTTDEEQAFPEDPLSGENAEDTADDSDLQQTDEEQIGSEDLNEQAPQNNDDKGQSSENAQGQNKLLIEYGNNPDYRIYTTQFDEIVKAEELANESDLRRLREMLDAYLERYQSMITRLANRLQRKLMAQQQRHWKFDLPEGQIDSARLARIVANPTVPLSFKEEQETEFKDTVLTLLLDNSGSMRGRPITISALCADILIRTLERCNIKTEVLGFTTRAWKGGKARELWMENGRPEKPGRLNDVRHIIYKEADAPWRRTKNNLGLMLKEGLLKENIDGEALAWAHNRLARRGEERKILMVISDGAPVDDSTLSSNPATLLENDLHSVIHRIERNSKIELSAIGIGHDVTQYYKNSITITDVDQLAEALMHKLERLFEK